MNDQQKEFLKLMGVNHEDVKIDNIIPKNEEKKVVNKNNIKQNRNDICNCGSNKKYKKCCGKVV